MKDLFKNIEYNKKMLIFIIVLIVILIILLFINSNVKNKYVDNKIYSEKKYVYTKYRNKTKNAYVPYINLKGDNVISVNNEIYNYAINYLNDSDPNTYVTYRYHNDNNILSVVMIYRKMINSELRYSFKTYVFDMKQDNKLLSDDEILNIYDTNRSYVDKKIKDSLKEYYNEEANNGYFNTTQCDFNNCYLKLREITDASIDANYFIENNSLVVYKSFQVYSRYNEERFFTRNHFKFIIK